MTFNKYPRRFLGSGIILFCLFGCTPKKDQQSESVSASVENKGISGLYEGLNSDLFVGELKIETRIEDEKVFTEGPAIDRNGMVYFTNVPVSKILKWDPKSKELSVFKEGSNSANGLRFSREGDLLVCEGGSGKISRIDMTTKASSTIAASFNGKGIQSPNDLDYDSSGRIYFSSRTSKPDLEKLNVKGLYRADPDGSVHQLLSEPEVDMPNGVVISPDEKKLYLIEAHPDKDRAREILVFDLDKEGTISNRRTLINFYPGRSGDGMCIDAEGNLYVAAGLHAERGNSETLDTRPGIHVISPEGKLLAYIQTPEDTITNCTFGGEDLKTLYVTCGTYLLSIRTKIAGKPSYQPNK